MLCIVEMSGGIFYLQQRIGRKSMLKEFKEFALKGNMMDMAIGIIIGAAFGAVITSLVKDILTPIIAAIFNAPDFTNSFIMLRNPTGETFTSLAAAQEAGAVVVGWGPLLNVLISFIIVAFVLFMLVKGMNRLRRKQDEAPAPPPGPTKEEELLTEIRDLLRENRS